MNMNKILVSILCFCLASNLYAEQEAQKCNSSILTLKTALEKAITSNLSLLALMKRVAYNLGIPAKGFGAVAVYFAVALQLFLFLWCSIMKRGFPRQI